MSIHEPPEIHTYHTNKPTDIVIKANHSDEKIYLHHILHELQKANHHKGNGVIYGIQFTITQDSPPIHLDFTKKANSVNIPDYVKLPDEEHGLTGLRLCNMGATGNFTGTGVLYYSVNMPSIEQGTVVLPVGTSQHRYKAQSRSARYRSMNLRAVLGDVTVNIALES